MTLAVELKSKVYSSFALWATVVLLAVQGVVHGLATGKTPLELGIHHGPDPKPRS